MVKLKESIPLGIAVNTGADGGTTSVNNIRPLKINFYHRIYFELL